MSTPLADTASTPERQLRILLSNDDGYLAPGLLELKQTLADLAQVYVLAPKVDRSACSSSLNTRQRLYCKEHSPDHHYCDGTSATCAHLGINGFFGFTPDMVVSGINCGANMGDDALYSGTLAAALEGRFLPRTSIAVSLVGNEMPTHYASAAQVAAVLVERVLQWQPRAGLVLNVNVPDLPLAQIKGWRATRLGHRTRSSTIKIAKDETGASYYELGLMGTGQFDHPQAHSQSLATLTDFEAISNQLISVTPISADMTHVECLDDVRTHLESVPIPKQPSS